MSFHIVEKTPLEHFQWAVVQFPKADPLELMKMAFNTGLTLAIENCDLKGSSREWLFDRMLGLDDAKLDPPLTAEDWARGP